MTAHLWITLGLALATGMALSRANMCFMRAAHAVSEGRYHPLVNVLLTVAAATVVFSVTGRLGMRDPAPWLLPGVTTVVGAILFAIGARLNGACTIGTMGRLAHGDIGALATFAGGALAVLVTPRAPAMGAQPAWFPGVELYWVGIVVLVALVALAMLLRGEEKLERTVETILLGGFAALLYSLRGQTSLMDAASAVAREGTMHEPVVVALAGLFVGAIGVSIATGRFHLSLARPRRIPFEFFGGALMTAGALSIPGASDVVAFYGLPSGSPHAVVAWIVILVTVAFSFRLTGSHMWSRVFPQKADPAGAR
ncbi:MAG: YeeE/YedE family protein [Hyphomicrobiales bacterium]|nr:YeeE/YedE family protein [Hyphomicrobiales bacterium]